MPAPKRPACTRASKAIMAAVMNHAYALLDLLLSDPAFEIRVFELLDSLLADLFLETIFRSMFPEVSENHHVPIHTATVTRLVRMPTPTPLAEIAVGIGMRTVKRLKRSVLTSDKGVREHVLELFEAIQLSWWTPSSNFVSNRMGNGPEYLMRAFFKRSAEFGGCVKATLESTQGRRPRGSGVGKMALIAWSMPMLAKLATAAPMNKKNVTCGAIDVASGCQIDSGEGLSDGAKGLIASCVITSVLTLVLAVFGIPRWSRDGFQAMWNWSRGLVRRHPDPEAPDGADGHGTIVAQAFGDPDTVNATAGGTEWAGTQPPRAHVRTRRYWLGFVPLPRSLERLFDGDVAHDVPRAPVPHTPEQRDIMLAGTGAVLEIVPQERPEELDDEDLGLPARVHGEEMEPREMTPAAQLPQTPVVDGVQVTRATRVLNNNAASQLEQPLTAKAALAKGNTN